MLHVHSAGASPFEGLVRGTGHDTLCSHGCSGSRRTFMAIALKNRPLCLRIQQRDKEASAVCGFRPASAHMRPTLEGEMPTASAIIARLQCVALVGASCTVFAITFSRTSLGRGGTRDGRVLSRLSPATGGVRANCLSGTGRSRSFRGCPNPAPSATSRPAPRSFALR